MNEFESEEPTAEYPVEAWSHEELQFMLRLEQLRLRRAETLFNLIIAANAAPEKR